MNLKTKKGPNVKAQKGLNIKNIFICYLSYLSGWIANLGVVPLLLFAFFLLRPAFVFLRALLFFVTRVFETISFLLQHKQLCELSRIKYLPRLILSVKIFVLPICLYSQEVPESTKNQSVTMAIGEIKELPLARMESFSVSNTDSVSHKHLPSKKLLLLKAKKLGTTEVYIWEKGEKQIYEVFVLPKKKLLRLRLLQKELNEIGLETNLIGDQVSARGSIKSFVHYKKVLSLQSIYAKSLKSELSISPSLEKVVLAKVIKNLFDDHINDFSCNLENLYVTCLLSDQRSPSKELEEHLSHELRVKFIRYNSHHKKKNYWLKIKIIQVESSHSGAYSFGLHQLSGDLKGIFEQGWSTLYENNKITLRDLGLDANLIAEPTVLVRPNKEITIQVGAEIPYVSTSGEGIQNTKFKFAGLKLKMKLSNEGDGLLLDYETEITKPRSNGEISGSKESSSARISLWQPLQLFEISFKTDSIDNESLPPINGVPLLESLFSNKTKSNIYKKITGLLLLEER